MALVMAWHEEVREFLAFNVTPRRIGINLTDHQRKEAIARSRTSDDGGGDEVPCARARERERERGEERKEVVRRGMDRSEEAHV